MKKPELLSPAGSLETALAAFDGGADAVYCGLAKFNARERAVNFSFPELRTLLEKAKSCDKKVYITFNTLLKSCELGEAAAFLAELAKTPPDALIVQDPGVIELVNNYFPFFTLHASTQIGIHNSCGIETMGKLNVKRVILERQITLDELKLIRKRTPLELEVFINGSLCCSLSGRCLLSSFLAGTSGNRGRCKQPCRRCYAASGKSKQDYFLSPFDLDGSSLVNELAAMGIDSFKIEGRLRGSDYIFKTARAYRLIIDDPDDPEAISEAETLLKSSSMRDRSTGFFFLKNHSSIINSASSGVFGIEAGTVEKFRNGMLQLKSGIRLHLGDRLRVINPKNRSDATFSLTALEEHGKKVIKCRPGAQIMLGKAPDFPAGSKVYKIGENGFDYRSAAEKLRPGRFPATLEITASADLWQVKFSHLPEYVWQKEVSFAPALKRPLSAEDIREVFASAPPEPWRIDDVKVVCSGDFFVPNSQLKELRREFWSSIKPQIPPYEKLFVRERKSLQNFLESEEKSLCSQEIRMPEDAFVIPAFISEFKLDAAAEKLSRFFASGGRNVIIEAFHAFALLKNAPQDVKIYTRFPLPVTNHQAAELLKSLGVAAFAPAPELDKEAVDELFSRTALPHFEDKTPVPLLVTRAKLDTLERTDGSGNFFTVRKSPIEETYQLFAVDSDPVGKFRNETLL